jgi:hypothetical protein
MPHPPLLPSLPPDPLPHFGAMESTLSMNMITGALSLALSNSRHMCISDLLLTPPPAWGRTPGSTGRLAPRQWPSQGVSSHTPEDPRGARQAGAQPPGAGTAPGMRGGTQSACPIAAGGGRSPQGLNSIPLIAARAAAMVQNSRSSKDPHCCLAKCGGHLRLPMSMMILMVSSSSFSSPLVCPPLILKEVWQLSLSRWTFLY